jgi:hypothetical protein
VLALVALLLTSQAPAQDQNDWAQQGRGASAAATPFSTRTSPFDPPTDNTFVTDDSPGLDTGCTFERDPEHPLTIDVLIDHPVGAVDANGYLQDANALIAAGLIPSTVEVILPAYDIDAPDEQDEFYLNGNFLGYFTGSDDIWKLNTFAIDVRKLKFPAPVAAGSAVTPAANRVQIRIDTAAGSTNRWCMSADWVALVLPIDVKYGLKLEPVAGATNRITVNAPASTATIDVIYDEVADADCNMTQTIGPQDQYPFAGSSESGFGNVAGEAKLRVTLKPCPSGGSSVGPEVEVNWSITGTSLQGTETWTGLTGDVTLEMPGQVGAYDVNLEVLLDGTAYRTVTRKLFVTKRSPLFKVGNPRLSWYALATAWAAGKSAESEILTALLAGTYNYGQTHWRYGYDFGPAQLCHWTELSADPISCDYSDCYVFSDVFDNMAATLGVGGLGDYPKKGINDGNFVTRASASLDPAFTGTVEPFPKNTQDYDRYLFASHSLRTRGPVYYDATFNRTYATDDAFIEWNLTGTMGADADGTFERTHEGKNIYSQTSPAYDHWRVTKAYKVAAGGSPLATGETMAVAPTSTELTITGNASYDTVDDNNDGIAEAVIANVEIQVLTAGTYLISGTLEKNGQVVSTQPRLSTPQPTSDTITGAPGLYTAVLRFSGEEIFQSGQDGPYDLKVTALGNSVDERTFATPAYAHTRFGERSARVRQLTDRTTDTDSDSRFDILQVEVEVEVAAAGEYILQGTLMKDGETVVNGSTTVTLTPGQHTVGVPFSGVAIFRSNQDGPYDALVSLLDPDTGSRDDLAGVTQAYRHGDFEGRIDPNGTLTDQGVDSNANGLFDLLRVTFGADVRAPGTYLVSGTLHDVARASAVVTERLMTLSAGVQNLQLDFLGPEIYAQQLDGPYLIAITLRDPGTQETLDGVRLGQQTTAHRYTDFDRSGGTSALRLTGVSTDQGIDSNGNTRYDILSVAVQVDIAVADTYQWSARLLDVNGKEIGFYSGKGSLGAGLKTINLRFSGTTIGANGIAGPYYVRGLLMYGQKGANLVSTNVADTQAYAAGLFEGFVAPLVGDLDGDGDVDRDDIDRLMARRNMPATGAGDPMDLNGDGTINAVDLRLLRLLCTRPNCVP